MNDPVHLVRILPFEKCPEFEVFLLPGLSIFSNFIEIEFYVVRISHLIKRAELAWSKIYEVQTSELIGM